MNLRLPIFYILVLLHTLFRRKRKYKYEVSLCLIFKDEAPYLKEWLEYHLLIGVEHFYLYNNFSSDNYKEVLAPYIEQGIVTLMEWPYMYAQTACYNECYHKTKDETHWLGFIDADEFVNLLKDNDIKIYLKHYNAYPSLYIYWRIFCTSGHVNETKEALLTERFTAAWPSLCNVGKSFINNDYRGFTAGCHISGVRWSGFYLNPIDDRYLFDPFSQIKNPYIYSLPYTPRAYVNHYYTRSYEFYSFKTLKRGDALNEMCNQRKQIPENFDNHELLCSVRDYSIQRWLTMLKLHMGMK